MIQKKKKKSLDSKMRVWGSSQFVGMNAISKVNDSLDPDSLPVSLNSHGPLLDIIGRGDTIRQYWAGLMMWWLGYEKG